LALWFVFTLLMLMPIIGNGVMHVAQGIFPVIPGEGSSYFAQIWGGSIGAMGVMLTGRRFSAA
jgi:hypothetical protein